MTTPPPPTPPLPTTVDYHALITTLEHLLPGLDPSRVMWVRITPSEVYAEWWDGTRARLHRMTIQHRQGSATEGGAPTPPPTGIDQTITKETR